MIELACQISRTARAGTARPRRAGLPRQSPARGSAGRGAAQRRRLDDHRGDRKAWLLSMLGLPDPEDDHRYRWEAVTPADLDHMTHGRRLLHVLADRARGHAALAEARRKAAEATAELSATRRAA